MIQIENQSYLVAGVTGLEPATSCVTGRRSNQLSYTPKWWALKDSNLRPSRCKRDALPTELSAPKNTLGFTIRRGKKEINFYIYYKSSLENLLYLILDEYFIFFIT